MKFPSISSFFRSIDLFMLLPVAVLVTFSLVTLYTLDFSIFKSQLIFLVIGIGFLLFFSQFNIAVLKYYSLPIYIISIFLLAFVLLLGAETRGSTRWLNFLGVGIQFSELLKPFLAICMSTYLTNLKNYSFRSFITGIILLGPIVLLIFLQPDLGNALIYLGVVMAALILYGFPIKWFIGGFLMWLVSLPFFWLTLHDYQRQRILTFINPSRDPLGKSYNAIQAVIAVGSGMFLGRGLGQGTQVGLRFLPESHTDFIFATISEELGLIGSVVIIICFAVIFYRIYLIIQNSQDNFSKTFSIFVLLIIFVHFFVNVGMNIGLVPIVGVTLPFVSYGGSSLLTNFILLGMLFALNKKSKRDVLEIR